MHLVYFSNIYCIFGIIQIKMCMYEFSKRIGRQEMNRIQIQILPLTMDQNPDPRFPEKDIFAHLFFRVVDPY